MIALKTFGVLCLMLVFLLPAFSLIFDSPGKSKTAKLEKNGKREIKINRIHPLEYLIIILPACLLLIGLFTNNRSEKIISYTILGIGFSYFLLSQYNNRINIPWVKTTIFLISLALGITGYILSLTNYDYRFESGLSSLVSLFLPLLTFVYLISTREIIKQITNTYPLTLDKTFKVGNFSSRLGRKANYWDGIWTLWNMFGLPILIIFLIKR